MSDIRYKAVRNREIHAMRRGGVTLKLIGEKFGISPERVRQIERKVDRLDKQAMKTPEGWTDLVNP